MVTQKFGWDTRHHIEQMSRHKLRRKIVEEAGHGGSPPTVQAVG
jgi:anaerobic magnesium-protoporphyrin IX monomethyl ester cyclase